MVNMAQSNEEHEFYTIVQIHQDIVTPIKANHFYMDTVEYDLCTLGRRSHFYDFQYPDGVVITTLLNQIKEKFILNNLFVQKVKISITSEIYI